MLRVKRDEPILKKRKLVVTRILLEVLDERANLSRD